MDYYYFIGKILGLCLFFSAVHYFYTAVMHSNYLAFPSGWRKMYIGKIYIVFVGSGLVIAIYQGSDFLLSGIPESLGWWDQDGETYVPIKFAIALIAAILFVPTIFDLAARAARSTIDSDIIEFIRQSLSEISLKVFEDQGEIAISINEKMKEIQNFTNSKSYDSVFDGLFKIILGYRRTEEEIKQRSDLEIEGLRRIISTPFDELEALRGEFEEEELAQDDTNASEIYQRLIADLDQSLQLRS